MDRHRTRLALVGVGAFLIPIAAFAWGAQDALPRDFSFASLGDFLGASENSPP